MEVKVFRKNLLIHKTECLVLGRFEGRGENILIDQADQALDGVIKKTISAGDFKGKLNQTLLFYSNDKISPARILLVGFGKKREFTLEKLRQASGTAAKAAQKLGLNMVSSSFHQLVEGMFPLIDIGQAITEGTLLSLYSFDELKTEKKERPKKIKAFNIVSPLRQKKIEELETGAIKGKTIAEGVCFARDLVSQPANVATPSYLAEKAAAMAGEFGLKATILEKEDIGQLKMGAFLGVAQGSNEPPKFIIIEYSGGSKKKRPYVLVGKAITFDSGGISIKPSAGMEEMKTDMSGGAAVIGAMKVVASLKLPVNVVGLVPATENLPGGSALKPGDILTSMSGQTIEVVNTDAEGRLILADALTYAERYNPMAVIDIATLTGACVIALGNHATGLLGNNEALKGAIIKAGEETGEKVWELPLWESYKEQIKSDIADMKNVGGREAGTITAAAFLDKFASKYHWAHLDIAGTAWEKKDKPYIPKGGSGVGVRLFTHFLEAAVT